MAGQHNEADDRGDFQGTEINFARAYHDARELMGLKSTNLDDLHYHTGLLYVNAPDKWSKPFLMLLDEMTMRMDLLSRLPR